MRNSRPKALDFLLQGTDIQQKAMALNRLNRAVKNLLPTELHPYICVANYRQSILILHVANASWLNRLRYEQNNLLTALRQEMLPSLIAIETQINPTLISIDTSSTKNCEAPRKISKNTANLLYSLAEKSHASLQVKLKRLANLADKSTD